MNATIPSSGSAPEREIIVGIDLGTTNSLIAWFDAGGPVCIPDARGRNLLPSVVRLSGQTGQMEAIGFEARQHAVEHPLATVFSVKRLMGRGIKDVQGELAYLPYQVVAGEQNTARVKVGDRVFSPQEVSAMILKELKARAEAHLKKPVRKAVITVPAYFDDAQRQATRDAGRIAGLEVVRIVNEPTAASLAYHVGLRGARNRASLHPALKGPACASSAGGLPVVGSGSTQTPSPQPSPAPGEGSGGETVAVFDLGGGTFDFSILRLQATEGAEGEEGGVVDQVLGTAGDTHLGGDDVDRMIVELFQKEIREKFGQGIEFPPSTRQAFRTFAEAMKIRLSSEERAQVQVDLGQGRVYERVMERAELEMLMRPWVEKALACCRSALKRAELDAGAMERVILVGGSTRIPLVRNAVAEMFGLEPYTALNPDEVVALGAAVQASILAGGQKGMLLLDVIPLSLGIETLGGAVAKLIVANTTIPARATEKFSTYVDGQTSVSIHVLQGERELVADCRSLGKFELKGIPPMPAGLPKIEVTFLVDANGILNVSAIEQRSGKAASLQVVPNHGLTKEEVRKMEAESLQFAREDMTAHRLIDLRNQARLDIRNIERQMQRVGDEVDPGYRAEIEKQKARIQGFIENANPDADAFAKALTELDHATVRLAEIAIKKTLSEG